MRIKLDQGSPSSPDGDTARLKNRSLNCQTPKTRPRAAVPSCTAVTCLGPAFRSVQTLPGLHPQQALRTDQIGPDQAERLPLHAPARLPDSTSGWERSQAAQKCPCWQFCCGF